MGGFAPEMHKNFLPFYIIGFFYEGTYFWRGPAPWITSVFFAFLLSRIILDGGTYFWGALPLNYISILLPFYLTGLFWMRGPIFSWALPLNYVSNFFAFLLDKIFFNKGTYFLGALPLPLNIFLPIYLKGFFMRGPTFGGPAL